MGKPYADPSTSGSLGLPPAFTPAVGASFAVVKTSEIELSFAPDLSFPSFQDIRFALAMTFAVADIFFLNAAYTFDAREAFGIEPSRSLPIAFGVTLKLSGIGVKTAGQDVMELNSSIAAAPLEDGVWGFGLGVNVPIGIRDAPPPAIAMDVEGIRCISPTVDGVKDDMVLSLGIDDHRYVKGYRFVVPFADHPIVREGVRVVVNDSKDIMLVDEASNGQELLAATIESSREKPVHERLSDQEYRVLCLMAAGKSLSGTARELGVGPSAVGTYRSRIMGKMGFKNNADLVRYALKNGLID
jgi:DNA-binding CsgD family transcriptional regulator